MNKDRKGVKSKAGKSSGLYYRAEREEEITYHIPPPFLFIKSYHHRFSKAEFELFREENLIIMAWDQTLPPQKNKSAELIKKGAVSLRCG